MSKNYHRRLFYSSLANQKRLLSRLIELQRTTQPIESVTSNESAPACVVQLRTSKRILKYGHTISFNDFGFERKTYRLTNHWNYTNTLKLCYSSRIRLYRHAATKKDVDNAIIKHRNTLVRKKDDTFALPKSNKLQFKGYNKTMAQYREAIGG